METRFYSQLSTGKWLNRVDTGSPMTEAEAKAHVAAQFELAESDVLVVTNSTLTDDDLTTLKAAADWSGIGVPVAEVVNSGNRIDPPTVAVAKTREQELVLKLGAKTATLADIVELLALERGV